MHESIEGINIYQIEYPNELPEHFPHAKRIHLPWHADVASSKTSFTPDPFDYSP